MRGKVPSALQLSESLGHRLASWLFLSPLFAKTTRPLRFLPLSLAILILGAFGSAIASSQSMLLFYSSFTSFQFQTTVVIYFFNWISLLIFSDLVISVFLKRTGGDLQLFVCLGIASFPVALFPYVYIFISFEVARYVLFFLQIWSVLLMSSAYSFSKGLRLDKSIILSLLVLYLNTVVLLATGRLS